MKEDDAEHLLEDLRALEPLLDGNPRGLRNGRKSIAAALLRALGGAKITERRIAHAIDAFSFAVRGCYEGSNQCQMLEEVLETIGIANTRESAMQALWERAHEALGELRKEIELLRPRSS